MANQSDAYKFKEQIDYLADMVGADVPKDRLKMVVEDIANTVDVSDRSARVLGKTDATIVGDSVGLAQESTLSSTLSREIATWSAGTLPVEQQSPVGIEADDGTGTVSAIERDGKALLVQHDGVLDVSSRDGRNLGDVDVTALTDASPTSATAGGTGSANAATADLGPLRKDVDVFYDVSGAATVTIEVSTDGSTWRQFETISESAAASDVAQITTTYQHVRAYVDQNLNTLELASKGI